MIQKREEIEKIEKARKIAMRVHGTQVDKKNYPFLADVYDVAKRVKKFGITYEIVGLLHDAIEDASPNKFKKEIISEIISSFDDKIFTAIMAMSKSKEEDYFRDYLPRVKQTLLLLR